MLTPQDLQQVYFDKARFGGYSMESVDNFLEPLMNDYVTLYKENAVLKSKMRLLVERLEAYRGKEAEMKQAIAETQRNCDEMLADAERRSRELLANAENNARAQSQTIAGAVQSKQALLSECKAETLAYVAAAEAELLKQQAALDALKKLAEAEQKPEPAPTEKKPYDFDLEADEPVLAPVSEPVPELPQTQEDIASEIEQSVEKIMENVPTPPDELAKTKVMPAVDFGVRDDKFNDLQFGRNYDPTK